MFLFTRCFYTSQNSRISFLYIINIFAILKFHYRNFLKERRDTHLILELLGEALIRPFFIWQGAIKTGAHSIIHMPYAKADFVY